MTRRLFVSVSPNEAAVTHLADFLALVGPPEGQPKLSPQPNWHITTAFLGDVDDDRGADFVEHLGEHLLGTEPFPLALRGGGAFGTPHEPRIWWAGVDDPTGALPEINAACLRAARQAGIAVAREHYLAHLTLFRGRPHPSARWMASWDDYRGPTWTVDAVHLMESVMGRTGSHYRSLEQINLRKYV